MILQYLLPSKIGNICLYPSKKLIVTIDYLYFSAVWVETKKEKRVVKHLTKVFDFESLEENRKNFFERESLALFFKEVLEATDKDAEIEIILPSEIAIFKEIKLPLEDPEKIRQILPFELEQHLIIDPSEMSFDFVSNGIYEGQHSIFLAAVKNTAMTKLQEIFNLYDLSCYKVTLDCILIHHQKALLVSASSFLEIVMVIKDSNILIMAYVNQMLKQVFSFSAGLFSALEGIAKNSGISIAEVREKVEKEEIAIDQLAAEVKKIMTSVKIHLETITLHYSSKGSVDKFAVVNLTSLQKLDTSIFCETSSESTFQYLNIAELVSSNIPDKDKLDQYSALNILNISENLSERDFNLGQNFFYLPDKNLISKQMLIALSLFVMSVVYLIFSGYFSTKKLNSLLNKKRDHSKIELQNLLPKESAKKKFNAKAMLTEAKKNLENLSSLQKDFSYQIPNFLEIWLDLTRLLDTTRFGVSINSMKIEQPKDQSYQISIQGTFEQAKSVTEMDDFAAFSRVISLSKQFSLKQPITQNDTSTPSKILFNMVLGLERYENSK